MPLVFADNTARSGARLGSADAEPRPVKERMRKYLRRYA